MFNIPPKRDQNLDYSRSRPRHTLRVIRAIPTTTLVMQDHE